MRHGLDETRDEGRSGPGRMWNSGKQELRREVAFGAGRYEGTDL
ncbi:MAG: hypothetical protein RLZZ221_501 [Verrucomicrobiota bacterium]